MFKLIIILVCVISPCYLYPIWSTGNDLLDPFSDYDMFGSNTDTNDYASLDPDTNDDDIFSSLFTTNDFQYRRKPQPPYSDEDLTEIPASRGFHFRRHFIYDPMSGQFLELDTDEQQPDQSTLLQSIGNLRELINTLSLIEQINALVKDLQEDLKTSGSDEETTVDEDNQTKEIDEVAVGSSVNNPNVDVKIIFDGYDDVTAKTTTTDSSAIEDSDEYVNVITNTVDENIETTAADVNFDNSEFNLPTESAANTARPTEWDDYSDEMKDLFWRNIEEKQSKLKPNSPAGFREQNVRFYPVMNSLEGTAMKQPIYEVIGL